jgi:hypothetical protein
MNLKQTIIISKAGLRHGFCAFLNLYHWMVPKFGNLSQYFKNAIVTCISGIKFGITNRKTPNQKNPLSQKVNFSEYLKLTDFYLEFRNHIKMRKKNIKCAP